MHLVQFLFIVLAALFFYRAIANLKKKKITLKGFIFWACLWAIMIIVAISPGTTNFLSKILGIGRGVDVAVYFSILLIFFLIYKIGIRLEKIEHEITKIVRQDALKKRIFKK
jgi:hypothetical protein